jgi:hypothetical protein
MQSPDARSDDENQSAHLPTKQVIENAMKKRNQEI